MAEWVNQDSDKVLMSIQNSKNPDQTIYLVLDESHRYLETQGLSNFFGLKEIRLDTADVLGSLEEYAYLLSYIMETISKADELHLPYRYLSRFEFRGQQYRLEDEGEYAVLRRTSEIGPVSF